VQLAAVTNTFTWSAGGDAGPTAIGGETNASGEGNPSFGFAGNIDEVRVYQSSLNAGQVNRIRQETRPCVVPPAVDHYELTLATSSIACLATTVTVTACADTSSPCTNKVTTLAGQTATLASSAGTLATTSVSFNASGDASTTLSYPTAADGTPVTVTLSSESTAAANPRKCCPDGAACGVANSCSTTFNTAGFIFSGSPNGGALTVPSQVAGVESPTIYLRAVRTSTTTKACESPLSAAATYPVNFSVTCNNPASCSGGGPWLYVTPSPGAETAAPGSVAMPFDADGNAPFSFDYRDVGAVTLGASATVNGATLAGSSNAFVVKPFGLVVSDIKRAADDFANPAAANASGSVFMRAGDAIELTVTSVNALAAATPNFGNEAPTPQSIQLSSSLVLPSPGNNPGLGNATISGGFSGGAKTVTNVTFGEVGIITLTPAISDYLGAGAVNGTTTGNVGRFIPHDFGVAWNVPEFAPACGAFTYLGQTFGYATPPVLTVTARNQSGGTTGNYRGAFFKITDASLTGKAYAAAVGTLDFAGIATPDPDIVDNADGTATLTFDALTSTAALAIRFQRPTAAPPAPIAAFDADISLSINVLDTDSVAYASNPARVGQAIAGNGIAFTGGNKQMRFGRLRMQNGLASSGALSLPAPIEVQYWDSAASVFRRSATDTCTSFVPGDFSLTPALGAAAVSAVSLSGGAGSILVSGPGAGVSGSVVIAPTALPDYLKGAWTGAAWDDDPAARASWGVFGSQPRNFIYQRENF
jgi:MSHA biogenesis protein MshQ